MRRDARNVYDAHLDVMQGRLAETLFLRVLLARHRAALQMPTPWLPLDERTDAPFSLRLQAASGASSSVSTSKRISRLSWSVESSFILGADTRCALVGSGNGLRGRRLGREIDAHDVVIRINRLHNVSDPVWVADLGRKTTVYYTKVCSLHSESMRVWGHSTLQGGHNNEGNPLVWFCPLASPPPATGHCSIGAIAMKYQANRCTSHAMAAVQGRMRAAAPTIPIALETPEASRAADALRPDKPDATTGFHAYYDFAAECRHMSIYGFTGEATLDGHAIDGHNVSVEHGVLRALVAANPLHRIVE